MQTELDFHILIWSRFLMKSRLTLSARKTSLWRKKTCTRILNPGSRWMPMRWIYKNQKSREKPAFFLTLICMPDGFPVRPEKSRRRGCCLAEVFHLKSSRQQGLQSSSGQRGATVLLRTAGCIPWRTAVFWQQEIQLKRNTPAAPMR